MMIALPDIGLCPQASLSATTIMAIITVESRGDPLAIRVNGGAVTVPRPADAADAAATAERLMAEGYSLDLGLMQVNTTNLAALHLSVRDLFVPCLNIAAGAFIFRQDYDAALAAAKTGPAAVQAALSAYNSGNFVTGFGNGYVAHYDVAGGVDAVMARSGPEAFVPTAPVIRGSIRLRRADFSVSPQAAIALWGIAHMPAATRIALRVELYGDLPAAPSQAARFR